MCIKVLVPAHTLTKVQRITEKTEMEEGFFQKQSLNWYIGIQRKEAFQCNLCDTSFSQKRHLNRHIESVHKGIKPFKCKYCDASFSQKENLRGHIESVHERKKPFKCNACDASFSQKCDLNRHIESVHEEKKTFKCNICDSKTFKWAY